MGKTPPNVFFREMIINRQKNTVLQVLHSENIGKKSPTGSIEARSPLQRPDRDLAPKNSSKGLLQKIDTNSISIQKTVDRPSMERRPKRKTDERYATENLPIFYKKTGLLQKVDHRKRKSSIEKSLSQDLYQQNIANRSSSDRRQVFFRGRMTKVLLRMTYSECYVEISLPWRKDYLLQKKTVDKSFVEKIPTPIEKRQKIYILQRKGRRKTCFRERTL